MIYDMYGFPDELYRVRYPVRGSTAFARAALRLLGDAAEADNSWGVDHGTWSVLRHIYPNADVPVFQLSVDASAPARSHYETGAKLRALRDEGVLIFGSGNVVHNLSRVNWDMDGGYSWAEDFDGYIKQSILAGNDDNVVDYRRAGSSSSHAFHLLDHYAPLLYALGAKDAADSAVVFNDACVLGSLSMTGYLFG
jgi:4,5-DOPA dioxygenase extradiol